VYMCVLSTNTLQSGVKILLPFTHLSASCAVGKNRKHLFVTFSNTEELCFINKKNVIHNSKPLGYYYFYIMNSFLIHVRPEKILLEQ